MNEKEFIKMSKNCKYCVYHKQLPFCREDNTWCSSYVPDKKMLRKILYLFFLI